MADKDRLPRILASAPFAMQTAHSQNRASLRRKLGGAKLKPNLPLDALRKDFAQRVQRWIGLELDPSQLAPEASSVL